MMSIMHEKHRQALVEEIRGIKRQLNDYPDDPGDVLHRTLNVLWSVLDPETMERKETVTLKVTLKQFIDELNQIPEEHKENVVISIAGSTILEAIKHVAEYPYPNSMIKWHCNAKLINLGFKEIK